MQRSAYKQLQEMAAATNAAAMTSSCMAAVLTTGKARQWKPSGRMSRFGTGADSDSWLGDPAGMHVLGAMQEAVEVLRSRLCSVCVSATIFIDVRVVVRDGKVGDIRTDGARITRHLLFRVTAFETAFFLYCPMLGWKMFVV